MAFPIKDLTNKTIATLADCESEPINIPGSIQPHGVLLAVDESLVVQVCSANTGESLGRKPEAILQKPLALVDENLAAEVQARAAKRHPNQKPFLLGINGQRWQVFLGSNDEGLLLVELEKAADDAPPSHDPFDQTLQFVSFIGKTKTLLELCQWTAVQIREITGYDRVMVYRFDTAYNGEVIAESRQERLEPFLHLHYPHTDIPPQARELYLQNLMRMIADVHYQPVPLLAADNGGVDNPDLGQVGLRSVSPIHLQYLKNMGVGATLTISLILDGRLWGLVACHHTTPRHLGYEQRKAALLQAQFFTSQIKVRQVAEEHELTLTVEAHLQQLLNALKQAGDFELQFNGFTSLLAVANATGVAVLHKGRLYEKGKVPSRDRVMKLFGWLAEQASGLQFYTSSLTEHYSEGDRISDYASGILYHKLGDPHKDAIVWFREEIEQTINWAGDPGKAVTRNPENLLTPRSSFAIFRQLVKNQSTDWKVPEINAASRFANTLQNQVHIGYLQAEESRQRLLNEQLQKANKELANINWITTHDLKEPVRKILIFASMAMGKEEKELSQNVLNSLNRIQHSARRMQSLVDDIIAYSLTDDKTASFVPVDLNKVMEEVAEAFADELREKKAVLLTEQLPTITGIAYQLRQLFVNLVGNSLKFAREEEPMKLEISCKKTKGLIPTQQPGESRSFYLVSFKDNGIGFDDKHREKIFDIFYRLHPKEAYAGTGIGLAICQRIAENHGGLITASGQPGAGATFNLYLPAEDR